MEITIESLRVVWLRQIRIDSLLSMVQKYLEIAVIK